MTIGVSMRLARTIAAAFLALALCIGTALALDEAAIGQAERAAETFRAGLAQIEKELQSPAITDPQLSNFRGGLEDIRAKSLLAAAALAQPVAEITQQIGLLGPAPATDAPPEAPAVAKQRTDLTAILNRVQGAKSQLELASVSAEQLASRVSALQRSLFVSRVFEGGRSILNPLLWLDTGVGISLMWGRLAALFTNWWAGVGQTADFNGLVLIPLFLTGFVSLYILARARMRRWGNAELIANRSPGDFDRLWRVLRAVIATFAALLAVFLPVYIALRVSGLMTPRFELVYSAAVEVIFTTVIYWFLARRVAAPGQPLWRIVDLDGQAAARLPVLAGLTAFVSVVTRSMGQIADGLYLPVGYTIGQSAVSAIVMLVLLASILLTLRNQQGLPGKTPGRKLYFRWAAKFVPVLWLSIAVGVVALFFGYVALASFLSQQIFESAVLVMVLFLLHHLSDAAVEASLDPQSGFGGLLRRVTGLGERGIERLGLLFRTVVDLVLLVAGLPLLFVLWTVTWIDFRSMLNTAFFGFRVGDITISPWSAMMVVLVLVCGIVLTNLIVRWLDRRILTQTRVDKGVQDSLRKGASYAGYIVASIAAFTAAGLDFSTLAIIAGALGVGIGFGLQSIVNNFVSGLILLAERPVRVGDWVVLDAGEGLVKRINVRSTEIETFDSCSIIVPNSMLITGAVKNWTHGDTMGRLTVAITVVFGSDAETVRDILTEAARAHPKVLTYPEPQIMLVRFSLYGLDFEIKANVAHIFDGAFVASDLRYEILKAFAEKGISIAQQPLLLQAPKG